MKRSIKIKYIKSASRSEAHRVEWDASISHFLFRRNTPTKIINAPNAWVIEIGLCNNNQPSKSAHSGINQ